MIHTVWPYLAVMLLSAGLFPAVERRYGWKLFAVLPPIVLTYLFVTALAVSGLWQVNGKNKTTSRPAATTGRGRSAGAIARGSDTPRSDTPRGALRAAGVPSVRTFPRT